MREVEEAVLKAQAHQMETRAAAAEAKLDE